MSTASNYISKINQEFPVAGKDNPSQGFRDNFKNITQALSTINSDVENLNISAVQTTQTNDFDNNIIKQATFQDCSSVIFDETSTTQTGDVTVDFSAGHYQKFKIGEGTHRFSVTNWPGSGKFSSLILSISTASTAPTYVDFGATNLYNLSTVDIPSFVEQGRPKVFELWSDGDDTNLFVKEISARIYDTDVNTTHVTATNIVSTNLTARSFLLGSNTFTTATNSATPQFTTVVKGNSKSGNLALLPNQVKTSITSNPALDYPGDTTASSFSVVSTDGIMNSSTFVFANSATVFTVQSFTTNTVTVSPYFPVATFSLSEEITFTNPQFSNQPTVVSLTTSRPSSTTAAKGDLKGKIYVDSDEIFISYADYSPSTTNWVKAVTVNGSHTLTGINTFDGNVILGTAASLTSNNTTDSSALGNGSVVLNGGVSIAKNLRVAGQSYLSTATFTGAVSFTTATLSGSLSIASTASFASSATFSSAATFSTINANNVITSNIPIVNPMYIGDFEFTTQAVKPRTDTFNTFGDAVKRFGNIYSIAANLGGTVASATEFYPSSDNAITLGKSGARWSQVWAGLGTIQTSDLRLKDNVEDSKLGLNFINDLRPVSFNFKNSPASTNWGLIAQEVKATLDNHNADFAGWVLDNPTDPTSTQNLIYTEFLGPLIKAVQELSEQNQNLQQQIDELKKNLK